MERHKCKLCFRSFSNGRALGGHMRSHMMNLPIAAKHDDPPVPPSKAPELGEEAESASSPSRTQSNSEDDEKALFYGLRENPKRSIRLVDPEFSFAVVDSGSVVILQDRESETESSRNPTRRRSDRRSGREERFKRAESWAEPEAASSAVSDATTEEDVAFCLMMMSRDKWETKRRREDSDDGDERYDGGDTSDDDDEEFEELAKSAIKCNSRSNKYKCETCDKSFRSYQALGGHRASHKKIKLSASDSNHTESAPRSERAGASNVNAVTASPEKKIHECPVCFRVFSSGQALGGHKRSHVLVGNANNSPPAKLREAMTKTTTIVSPVVMVVDRRLSKLGESLIDLNLPAPDYDDDHDEDEDEDEDEEEDDEDDRISQIELSAVSDAEFVNPIVRQ